MEARHRLLREIIRHYPEFKALCRQQELVGGRPGLFEKTGDWDLSYKGLSINILDLQGCLKNLSPRKKEAVFYNVIMDMKQKDVAEIMNITTVSVGQYVEQAMLQVAKELWPDEDVS